MPQIPQPEVSDSDFGAFEAADKAAAVEHYTDMADQAAVMFRDSDHRLSYEIRSRVQNTKTGSRWVSATNIREVKLYICAPDVTSTLSMTPAEAAALGEELLAAACAARNAVRAQ